MEPNKLENQIREKLNNRKINPSEAAWDRLDAMLTINEKPKLRLIWFYVAASVAGFLLVGTIFFNQKESSIDGSKNNVVINDKIQKDSLKTKDKSIINELDYSKAILKQETKPLVQIYKKEESNIKNQTIKGQEEVVAEIQPFSQNEQIVVNKNTIRTDIDSLLASASKPNPDIKKSFIKINSATLLGQVDGELQVSFREKALKTITKKYKEAKEALANRNNQ
ncbi:hypothetical protein [Flavobacterium soyangense]|uniref:Uncharacterized protein n=1 Tax=Flavobacterium soyangense TaxID=2023265 RepID=A0A930Y1E2_9FLAO|nr:hypothetical protein [Flavobacterium soyangense]MBF2709384.1 hypothetical protein [Flavobacterium soyangense]